MATSRVNAGKAPDFDQPIDRSHSHAEKFDGRLAKFGRTDVQPLWIADMDFAAPVCITEALVARARHPIYGYTQYPESLFHSLIDWCSRRHRWQPERDWLLPASGVAASLSAAIHACTAPGDAVIVHPPVYPGFFRAVEDAGRRLQYNPLHESGGHYTMDFAQLEQLARDGARTLLLCNPHNPAGRAWNADELDQLLQIARRHGLTIISDEVHGDLALPCHRYQPLPGVARPDDRIITVLSPGKTFNLQGLPLAILATPRADLREALRHAINTMHLGEANPFTIAAAEAAWHDGDHWLDALLDYLAGTRDFVAGYLRTHLPAIHLQPPEAGYLLWLDCRGLGMDDSKLREFFIQRCKLGLNPGIDFGPGGSGFMRMNIGAPRPQIEAALCAIHTP